MDIRWPAPAKLNLFLHITGQRPDGYHLLQTLFQFLDYADYLSFTVREDGYIGRVCSIAGVADAQDLTLQAARALQQYSATALGVDIRLEKYLPIGGGLGGGSSDAATTLVALNYLWRLGLSYEQLGEIGLTLGADVPIFLYGRTAWAEGVGEKLRGVRIPEDIYLVVKPAANVATAEIFAAAELTRNRTPITIRDFLAGKTENVCQPVVANRYPEVAQALRWLHDYAPARMTGTGSCVFARFATHKEAEAVLRQLPDRWQGFVAKGMSQSPLHQLMGVLEGTVCD